MKLLVYFLFLYFIFVLSTFKRFKGATGFTLLKFWRINFELWYFPAGFSIEEHKHPNEYIKIIRLFGEAVFYKNRNGKIVSHAAAWYNYWKFTYNIRNNEYHWLVAGKKMPLVVINDEYWYPGCKITSAAQDIKFKDL